MSQATWNQRTVTSVYSKISKPVIGLAATLLVTAMLGCGGSGGGGDSFPSSGNYFIANNPAGAPGTISRVGSEFSLFGSLSGAGNEGMVVDRSGTLYQAADNISPAAVIMIDDFQSQFANGSPTAESVRLLGGPGTSTTTLLNPKGIEIVDGRFLVVADFGTGTVTTFSADAAGDVAPLASAPVSGGKPWDIAFDAGSNILYVALTNGDVDAFENFTNGLGVSGAQRTFTPTDNAGVKLSVNLHGIVFDSNRLFLSDVGVATAADSPDFAADGALFLVENVSAASGPVPVSVAVSGPSTGLGNPVDIILVDGTVFVAEKANDAFYAFPNFGTASGDVAPEVVVATLKPESLVYLP